MKTTLVVLAASVAFAGCGIQTSISGEAELELLSTSDVQQLCRDQQAYWENALSELEKRTYRCNILGAAAAARADSNFPDEARAACSNTYFDCMDSTPSSTTDICDSARVSSSCRATVQELNGCFVARTAEHRKYAKESTCGEIGADMKGFSLEACRPVRTKCDSLPSW